MNVVIFTLYKQHPISTWTLNELDILSKYKIKFLLPYVTVSKSIKKQKGWEKYGSNFIYVRRCHLLVSEIIYLFICQIKTLLKYPSRYIAVLLFIFSHFHWEYLLNFLKLTTVVQRIERFHPDLFYSHFHNNTYILAFIAAKFFRRKFGLVLHTTKPYKFDVSYVHSQASFIITKSEFVRQDYQKRFPYILPQKSITLSWGIDTQFFRPITFSNKFNNNYPFIMLSVSRFVETKGLVYLLKTCRLLTEEKVTYKCILIGDGPLKAMLNNYVNENKLSDHVKILPALTHSAKFKKILDSANVFVLPSVIDACGEYDLITNAVLEAMAMEKVVITTKVTGVYEVAKDGESIIFCRDKYPKDLAEKIKIVMDMPEEKRRNIGRKARQIVVEKFDKWKQGEKFVSFLRSQTHCQ